MPLDLFEAHSSAVGAEQYLRRGYETSNKRTGISGPERPLLVGKNPFGMKKEDESEREVATAMVLQILRHRREEFGYSELSGDDSEIEEYISGVQDCLAKKQQGAVFAQADQKRPLRQKAPLFVEEVRALECAMVLADDRSTEAVFIRYCLFCTHCCVKFSVGQRLDEPLADELLVEASTGFFKTAHIRGQAKRLLPLAGYSSGVTGVPWTQSWLKTRKQQGLIASEHTPTMPVLLLDGAWSTARLTTTEVSSWLVLVLRSRESSRADYACIGTHSVKSTLLSWCAKG
eukprot:6464102-Amphidinium_carterae.1